MVPPSLNHREISSRASSTKATASRARGTFPPRCQQIRDRSRSGGSCCQHRWQFQASQRRNGDIVGPTVWGSAASDARIPWGLGFTSRAARRLQRRVRQTSVCSDRSRRVKHSSKGSVHGLAGWECLGDLWIKDHNVALLSELLYILATNAAAHRTKVVFGSHVIFKRTDFFHKIVFPGMSPVGR